MVLRQPHLQGRSLLTLNDLSDAELLELLAFSAQLKARKRLHRATAEPLLRGCNVAMIFEKASTRTRCATAVACADEGAHVEYLGKNDIHFGKKESVPDSARVLGRMFDGILFRGFSHQHVELLAGHAGVPVWNGLTDDAHPTQILADLLTVQESFGRLAGLRLTYLGDGRNNVANSLMLGCAKVGLHYVNCCPPELSPAPAMVEHASRIAAARGAEVRVDHDPRSAVVGANVLYTDVWTSMGEESVFQQRVALLRPYQVNLELMRLTGNLESGKAIFLHCLPAFHNHDTELTSEIGALEVTEEVFEAPYSKVFDEAENRLHTIKAMIVSCLR